MLDFCDMNGYNQTVVIPLITSLISNPNTPFEQNRLLPCGLFCFLEKTIRRVYFLWYTLFILTGGDTMEYIRNTIEYPVYTSRAFQLYFDNMDIGMLDIETTGLSPKNSAFVLGGLVTPRDGYLEAEQYFAESLSREQETLNEFWAQSSGKDVLITFNGQHFDIPFIKERLSKPADPMPFHLDLFLLVKNFSPIRKFLPNLKQKSIENYMGLWQYRDDEISGKESVDLYYRFLTGKSDAIKQKILLHNHDDIVQLYRLLKIIEKSDFHKAMSNFGFPVKSSRENAPALVIEKISLKGGQLIISGRQYRNPAEYQCYDYNGNMCFVRFSKDAASFSIELPVIEQAGMMLLDLEALDLTGTPLDKYPACQEGFLILRSESGTNYMELNHFIKLFTERIIDQWITDK